MSVLRNTFNKGADFLSETGKSIRQVKFPVYMEQA